MGKLSVAKILGLIGPGAVVMYVIVAIFGFVLAKKRGNDSTTKKILGCVALVGTFVITFCIERFLSFRMSDIVSLMVMLAIYLFRLFGIGFSLWLFADYRPSRWVLGIIILASIVMGITYNYQVKLVNNIGAISTGNSNGFMTAFFNNPALLSYIKNLGWIIPIAVIIIDAFGTVRRKN